MEELLIAAIPAFLLLMGVEALSYRHLAEEARTELRGYEARDTRTSISMGLGYLASPACGTPSRSSRSPRSTRSAHCGSTWASGGAG